MTTKPRENGYENEIPLGPRRWLSPREIWGLIELSINEPEINLRSIFLSLPKRNFWGLIVLIASIFLRVTYVQNNHYSYIIRFFMGLLLISSIPILMLLPFIHLKLWSKGGMVFLRKVDMDKEPKQISFHRTGPYTILKYNPFFIWYAVALEGNWRKKAEFGLKWELFHWGTELLGVVLALIIYEL